MRDAHLLEYVRLALATALAALAFALGLFDGPDVFVRRARHTSHHVSRVIHRAARSTYAAR